jgi:hypothetical protein
MTDGMLPLLRNRLADQLWRPHIEEPLMPSLQKALQNYPSNRQYCNGLVQVKYVKLRLW